MPYNFVADSIHTKKFCSRLSSSEVHFLSICAMVCVIVGMYFCINMILITLSTFLAVTVINTHIRGDRKNRVPQWLRRVSFIDTETSTGQFSMT